jgi:serine/threonine protein kinase/Tfp pilus assembly protein PilF
MTLLKGTRLGPYEIMEPLGAGGMGEVYRARDTRLERDVAVKVLPETLSNDTALLARFDREAKLLATLSHPNILTVFDVGADHGVSYVVTELLEGETLTEVIRRSAVEWQKALEIGVSVAQGLFAAHSKGIIHRDLKPDNIFIATNSVVKILDFGLARVDQTPDQENVSRAATLFRDTSPGMLIGTIPYMSPEQVRGLPLDHRSDIFSFGCVLYEILAGSRPFASTSALEAIASILKDPTPDILDSNATVPPQLETVIQRCLEKDPQNRFQTVEELLQALKEIQPDAAPAPRRSHKRIDSVAVLPFLDVNPDPDSEYLVDGITDNIIHTLSQFPKLRVMARSTVFRYKNQMVNAVQVGRTLNVRAVLTGRLVHRGVQLIIQTELVDVLTGASIWGEEYTRDLEDLHSLEQEIARKITEKLQLKTVRKKKKIQRPTQNMEAYQLYLKGRYFWNKRTLDGFRKSIDCFDEAIHLDPEFALAYAGLADAYSFMGGYGYFPSREAYTKSNTEAIKALQLDPSLAEAHTSLATVKYRYDWNWKGAEESFRKALELNPGYITAHHWFGVFLVLRGRFKEGLAEIEKAAMLDPLSVVIQWTLGYSYYYARDYEKALKACWRALELDPAFARVYIDIGLCYIQQSKNQEAIYEIQRGIALLDPSPSLLATLAYAYGMLGEKQEAQKILDDLLEESKRQYVSPYSFALIHIGLGDKDQAFEYLDEALERREDALVSLKVNPRFDSLRSDARFDALLKRIGLS